MGIIDYWSATERIWKSQAVPDSSKPKPIDPKNFELTRPATVWKFNEISRMILNFYKIYNNYSILNKLLEFFNFFHCIYRKVRGKLIVDRFSMVLLG